MIFGINTTGDISKLSQISFEISLVVFMPNITTNQLLAILILSNFYHHFVSLLQKNFHVKKKEEVLSQKYSNTGTCKRQSLLPNTMQNLLLFLWIPPPSPSVSRLQEVVAHSGSTVGFSCGKSSPSHDCEILLFLIGGQLSELSTYKRWLHIVVQL